MVAATNISEYFLIFAAILGTTFFFRKIYLELNLFKAKKNK